MCRLAGNPVFAEAGSDRKAIAMVYNAAVKTLETAADAIVAEAEAREADDPFTRDELTADDTITNLRLAVNPTLKRNLTKASFRRIATEAVNLRR